MERHAHDLIRKSQIMTFFDLYRLLETVPLFRNLSFEPVRTGSDAFSMIDIWLN